MTRIIGGFASGMRLDVPPAGTRPTSARVREALFSALDAHDLLRDARVLDLYAGAGTFGFEALSRGARRVTFVDNSSRAITSCRDNERVFSARYAPESRPVIEIAKQSVDKFLRGPARTVDLIFIDPPYDLGNERLSIALDSLAPWLGEETVVVVERSSRSPEPSWPLTLQRERQKNYGETILWWAVAQRDERS